MEGVMMRGAHKSAIAVLDANGEIHIKEEELNAALYRGRIIKTPFLRGLVGLWDAMGLGTKALMWSADIALIETGFYRVEYDGNVGWIPENTDATTVEGDLDSVPPMNMEGKPIDDEGKVIKGDEDIPTETGVSVTLTGSESVKIFKKPESYAKVLAEVNSGSFTVTGYKAPGEQEDFFSGVVGTGMIVVSLALGMGLFVMLPTLTSSGVGEFLNLGPTPTTIIEEGTKLALFLGYITLIGQTQQVKRLFMYHGAEHKTINAYEAGAELTPETVQKYPIEHPRCGTAFLLNVILISVVINVIIGRFGGNIFLLVPARLLTIPIVAGIAYEWLRLSAKHVDNPLVKILIKPNLALQRLTTNQPTDDMAEVAIKALERVLVSEGLGEQAAAESDDRVTGSPSGAMPAEA